jgi:hypothetical protein
MFVKMNWKVKSEENTSKVAAMCLKITYEESECMIFMNFEDSRMF